MGGVHLRTDGGESVHPAYFRQFPGGLDVLFGGAVDRGAVRSGYVDYQKITFTISGTNHSIRARNDPITQYPASVHSLSFIQKSPTVTTRSMENAE